MSSARRRALTARLARQQRRTARLRKVRAVGGLTVGVFAVATVVLPALLASGAARAWVPLVLAVLWTVFAVVAFRPLGAAVRASVERERAIRRDLAAIETARRAPARAAGAVIDAAAAAAYRALDSADALAAAATDGLRSLTRRRRRRCAPHRRPASSSYRRTTDPYDDYWPTIPVMMLPFIL
ncbi:hypothetical protein ACWGJ9_11755 [Curtobacterium citreum]